MYWFKSNYATVLDAGGDNIVYNIAEVSMDHFLALRNEFGIEIVKRIENWGR